MNGDADSDRFFTLARGLLAVLDGSGRLLRVSEAWQETLGLPPARLVDRSILEFVHPSDRRRARAHLSGANQGARQDPVELRVLTADGGVHSVELSTTLDAATGRLYAAARDVTAARRTEDELRRAAQRYRHLFESVPVPMTVWDVETRRVVAANDAAVRQYGYRREQLVGLAIEELQDGDGQTPARHRRKNGSTFEVAVSEHPMDYDGHPARLVMAMDMSERRLLEEQLYEAQKMEAIGQLAGGIAHDFNNLLTAINGYSELMLASFEEGDPRREDAEQIHLAGERAAALTSQLLAFSRRQLLQPEKVDLNAVIEDIAPMLRRLIGAHIDLVVEAGARAPSVLADRSRLEQVVVNLSVNARDAMPRGGRLTITTEDLEMRTPRRLGDGVARPGRYVLLRVSDTGLGMDESTRRRAFEPFFTTKDRGRGTGLGLATAYGTVRQTGGQMRIASAPGKGTTFEIYLPSAPGITEAPRATRAEAPAARDRGTILLVEDEPTVRSLGERVLSDAGYTVLTAGNGTGAMELAEAHEGPIALLLTDLVMPGGSGLDVAERLLRGRPATRVLYMSGYAEDPGLAQGIADPDVELLPKPFTPEQLLDRVRGALAGER